MITGRGVEERREPAGAHGAALAGHGADRASRIERQLAAAQEITHIGSWEWDASSGVVSWSDELYRIYGFEPRSREITFDFFVSRLHPEDRERVQRDVAAALAQGGRFAYPERIVRPDGTVRELDTVGEAARGEDGRVTGLLGTCRDVTELARERRLQAAEHRALEMIASGVPIREILEAVVLAIEEHSPPTVGSVLLLDAEGARVRHGAAPHLPDTWNRAIDGAPIGPQAGSCGAAAALKQPVFVDDIEVDPRWERYRDLARAHGLRACWSTPILATDGRVLGTFALYYREPRRPGAADLELIARATHVAGIAIERRELEDQLRALSAHVESVREDERTGIAREIHDTVGQALTALKMDVAWIARRLAADAPADLRPVLEKLRAMSDATDEVLNEARRISAELRPGVLDDLGILAALEWQGQEFERRTGTTCVVHGDLDRVHLDRDLSTAVFRIFQEALTNVARHAEARRVDVRLERDGGSLRLLVADDGKGITKEALGRTSSLGLLGMRERARRLGGTVTVAAAEGRGTIVALALPLPERGAAT